MNEWQGDNDEHPWRRLESGDMQFTTAYLNTLTSMKEAAMPNDGTRT